MSHSLNFLEGLYRDYTGTAIGFTGDTRSLGIGSYDTLTNRWIRGAVFRGLRLARNEGMDPYSGPYITHCSSFHFLFHSLIPANQEPV